ncbi:MAG: hypothetical protein ABSC18_13180 [Verrucomicrobiota bacterium]
MTRDLPYHEYAEVPWYRRSITNSILLFLQLLTGMFFPLSVFVCLAVLTGDIYFDKKDANGNLKKWGFANKIAAVVFFIAWLALLFFNPFRQART